MVIYKVKKGPEVVVMEIETFEINEIKVLKPSPIVKLEYYCSTCSEYGGGQHYAELPVFLDDIKNSEQGDRISAYDIVDDRCNHAHGRVWDELTIIYKDDKKALLLIEKVSDDDRKEKREVVDMILVYF